MQAQSGVQQPVSLSQQQPQGQTAEQQPIQGQAVSTAAGGPGAVSVRVAESKWEVSLCDCCAGGGGPFCYGMFCGRCANASSRSNMDDSNCCFNCLCAHSIALRNIVREGYNIEGNCCMDIITNVCCEPCSACEVYNESVKRGPANRMRGANRSDVETPWNNGLFDMCQDMSVCCLGLFCGPCALAYSRKKFDDSNCLFNCCCIGGCLDRSLIREGYNIEGSCMGDICITAICYPCTACQIMNEVNSRGNIHETVVSVQPESMNR